MKITYRSILAVVALAILTVSTTTVQAEDYTYITNNGTITITGYKGPGGDVTIPDMINGLPVTSIGITGWLLPASRPGVFENCTTLTSVTIPLSVTNIGSSAFNSCSSLTNVTIPNGVTTIGTRAFERCVRLKSVAIPGTLTNWETECDGFGPSVSITFYGCTDLTEVSIGEGVQFIAPSAFLGCTSLRNVAIPSSVRLICAFSFLGCASLTDLSLPMGVSVIESAAFAGCASLARLTLPDSIVDIGGSESWLEPGAFSDCTNLSNVFIGKGLKSIAGMSFSGCVNLKSVCFEGSVPAITGSEAGPFEGSTNVVVYYLPGASGWGNTFGGRPTAPWVLPYPTILTTTPNFSIQTNAFGFRISWATNTSVIVEASTTLANPVWSPVSTNALIDGWTYFSDAEGTRYPARLYRIRSQ